MKVLIFGGNGFIGSALYKRLSILENIYAKVVNRNDLNFLNLSESLEYTIRSFMPDIILYAAGISRRFDLNEVAILNEHKLLSLLSNFNSKLIYLSSSLVYPVSDSQIPISESHNICPSGEYGFYKAICEDIVSLTKSWTIYRLSSIVGKKKNESVFKIIFDHAINKSQAISFKYSDSARDYMHVDLCAQIIVDQIIADLPLSNTCINLGLGKPLSLSEITYKFYEILQVGFLPSISFGKQRPEDPVSFTLDNSVMLGSVFPNTHQQVLDHCPISAYLNES